MTKRKREESQGCCQHPTERAAALHFLQRSCTRSQTADVGQRNDVDVRARALLTVDMRRDKQNGATNITVSMTTEPPQRHGGCGTLASSCSWVAKESHLWILCQVVAVRDDHDAL